MLINRPVKDGEIRILTSSSSDDSGADDIDPSEEICDKYSLVDMIMPYTIIKQQSSARLTWDVSIILLAIYQAITIPIVISFEPDMFESPTFKTLDSLIDLVFLFDICINFRTTYIDNKGEE